jgi:hypothetical protein
MYGSGGNFQLSLSLFREKSQVRDKFQAKNVTLWNTKRTLGPFTKVLYITRKIISRA